MKELLRNNLVFIGLSLILLVVLGLALLLIPTGELHLLLNNSHTHTRDIFYRYYTQVAEWFPYLLCVLLLLFGRIGDGLFATACMALSALSTQILKHIINAPRPVTWFANNMPDVQLPLVDGVTMNHWYSFPSGHTTSFFALAFAASILLTKTPMMAKQHRTTGLLLQAALFVLAALGGYSRIYLSQHFALDVFAGMVVGLGISLLCYVVFYRYKDQKWFNFRLFAKK